jgi:predicted dinucleotide-binding enzyme
MSKKIGILGSGAVAKTLAAGFKKHGYEVMAGSRDPKKLDVLKEAQNIQTGTFEEAAAFGEIIVLAVKGTAAKQVVSLAGPGNLQGKTVLDTTNPIAATPPVNGVLQYFTSPNSSLLEELQNDFPDVNFVKCFNSVGSAQMVNPDFGGEKPTMFICGNNDAAKAETKTILDQFGYETEDCGSVEAARAIEPLCMLWCVRGFREGKWAHAFRYLKK